MKIEFLGTGTSQGVPVIQCSCKVCLSSNTKDKRLRTAISIEEGDTSIIIDVGPDFRYRMLRSKLSRIQAVLLTHEHNDHIAGMDDLRPFNFIQNAVIPVYSKKRVLEDIKKKYHYAFAEKKYPGGPGYDLQEIEHGSRLDFGDLSITAFEVIHGDLPILSFRINDFVYITDAKTISPKSMEIASDAEVLVLNALRKEEHWSHFSLKEAIEMSIKLRAKKTYFTHVSHMMGLHKEEEKLLPENVYFAYDTLKIEL